MPFQPSKFSFFGHSDSRKFRFYVISTFGLFNPVLFRPSEISQSHFNPWTFRTNVILNFGLFGLLSFRPSDCSTLFYLCHFDLRNFRSSVFRLIEILVLCHFHLRTFRSYVRPLEISRSHFGPFIIRTNVISNFGLFGFLSFRPSDFST